MSGFVRCLTICNCEYVKIDKMFQIQTETEIEMFNFLTEFSKTRTNGFRPL